MQEENENSIPRVRIEHLPDADVHDDATWLPSSSKFSSFLCPGCSRLPYVPYQLTTIHIKASNPTAYCAHSFCSTCVLSGSCPICQLAFDPCSTVALNHWHERLRMAWSRIVVHCSWSGCLEKLGIDDLSSHEQECAHRLVKCHIPHCDKMVRPTELDAHIGVCPHAIRRCACGMAINNEKKAAHNCIASLRTALTDALADLRVYTWKLPKSCDGFGQPGSVCLDFAPYFSDDTMNEMHRRLRHPPKQTIPPETVHSVFTSSVFSTRTNSRTSNLHTARPRRSPVTSSDGGDSEDDESTPDMSDVD
jgi:hypothetical protein